MKPATDLGIALVGCGTVGGGVIELLRRKPVGTLKHIVAREPGKHSYPNVHSDWAKAVRDPDVDVVVELIGGTTTAKEIVLAAITAGKNVITANKALLAKHGREIFDAARNKNVTIGFEAAVAGGIPIIKALAESLAGNQVMAIQGILNGTSNFILSAMAESGMSYADALKEAQRLGYAEADPTLDVDGSDAAHKLAVLAQIAFGVTPNLHAIDKRGIAGLDSVDIRYAKELGYTIKLLAEAWHVGHDSIVPGPAGTLETYPTNHVSLHVSPVLLRNSDMLAQVRGAFNAVRVRGDAVGEALFQGPGAGRLPTASSVMSDLIDLSTGRAKATFAATRLWSDDDRGWRVVPSERVSSRFYLRALVKDQPGVLADVCRLLANETISIASVVQHEAEDGHPERMVPLVIMAHAASAGTFKRAVASIAKLESVTGNVVWYPVGD